MNDIFSRIISIIGLTTGSKKRKSEEQPEHLQFTKYRKVSNDFPKIINSPYEDDYHFLRTQQAQAQQKKLNSSAKNMSNRKTFAGKAYNFNTPRNNQKTYGDVEFSDEEDEENILHSGEYSYACPPPLASSSLKTRYSSGTLPQNAENIKPLRRNPRTTNIPIKIVDTPNGNVYINSNGANQNSSGYIEKPMCRNLHNGFQSNRIPYLAPIRKVSSPINDKYNCFAYNSDQKKSFLSIYKGKAKNLTHSSYVMGQPLKIVSQIYNEKEKDSYEDLLKKLAPNVYSNTNGRTPPLWNSKVIGRKSISSSNQQKATGLEILVDNIDLTKPKGFTRSSLYPSNANKITNGNVISLDDDEDDVIDLDDDDVQILNAVKKLSSYQNQEDKSEDEQKKRKDLPYVEPINSLRDKNELTPIINPEWLKSFQEKIEVRTNTKLRKCREAEEEVLKATKQTSDNERLLGEKMKNFHIGNEIIILDEEEAEEEIEFPDLIEYDEILKNAVYGGSADQVLITKFNMSICRRDIKTLCGDNWLNDEVINFYMNLLIERGDLKNSVGYPKVYAMNTFFIPKVATSGHSGVRRWTRKIDIFAHDIIPVPVHVSGVHWCMAIINLKEKTIKYYDSMRTPNPRVLDVLEQYLIDESLDKKKEHFDTSNFIKESVSDCPRQMNGSDCGVFSCMFAEYISRGKPITFSQQHMPYFRNKMILEIIQGKLLL